MEDSVFTKIIKGEIPCHKIYEDDKTLAFLDINPVAEGHTLVIPKKHVEFIWDLETSDYQALMKTTQLVGRRLREVIGTAYVGEMVVGTDVPHTHVHVIPFSEPQQLKRTIDRPDTPADPDALAALAEKLHFS